MSVPLAPWALTRRLFTWWETILEGVAGPWGCTGLGMPVFPFLPAMG